ncbi:MAG: T9SS type A sorting domain-containing protein [Bacteroidota bacterium]|jgi:thiol-disulfide isomerase/thioredoxin
MKLKLLLLFSSVCILNMQSQTVSQNWTHTDCITNNSYTLFNMLDSNKVVVMEFEMGCSSCVIAAQNLEGIKQAYDVSYPGQVKFFLMDYWANHTCTNIQTMVNNNSLSFGGFVGCATDKNYYSTSSPMPMIIVTGGPSHTVYYKSLSYDTTDNAAIAAAINQALSDIAASVQMASVTNLSVSLSSNPAFEEIYLNITSPSSLQMNVEVFSLLGEVVTRQKIEVNNKGFSQVKLNVPTLQSGVYFVKYRYGNLSKTLKFIAGR